MTNSCAVGRSNSAHVAPPEVSLPANVAMPDTVKSRTPLWLVTFTASPTAMSPSFAERRSITTWLASAGPLPSASDHGEDAESIHTPPNFGGPS
jgi:hypothetical protein